MKQIIIGGVEIRPGTTKTIELPVSKLYTQTTMTMPVHVKRGKKDGPCLFVSAAIHGDEIQGVEIIRRLLKRRVFGKLRGTIITIPVVNVFGFINHTRCLPDRRDLNRFFPGSKKDSLTSYLANLFMEEIVSNCTHGIDLHTGSNNRTNLPQIRASLKDPETSRLAMAFGAPVILDTDNIEGSLRSAMNAKGIPLLLYEAGEAHRFDEISIRAGVNGILSVMSELEMIPKYKSVRKKSPSYVATSDVRVRAPVSGILHNDVKLGVRVFKDQVIGLISDPLGEVSEKVLAKATGIVIGKILHPLVSKGDALFHIGKFKQPKSVEDIVEEFQDEFDVEERFESFD